MSDLDDTILKGEEILLSVLFFGRLNPEYISLSLGLVVCGSPLRHPGTEGALSWPRREEGGGVLATVLHEDGLGKEPFKTHITMAAHNKPSFIYWNVTPHSSITAHTGLPVLFIRLQLGFKTNIMYYLKYNYYFKKFRHIYLFDHVEQCTLLMWQVKSTVNLQEIRYNYVLYGNRTILCIKINYNNNIK
jgi:hypothetical protein